ncbi:hypothetical protein HK405_010860, partial [Cladochytrium tenue]
SRVESLHKSVDAVFRDSLAVRDAFQALSEIVRRFHVAVQSAILLLERIESAWSGTRVWKSRNFQAQLAAVNNELTGCADDLSLVLNMKSMAHNDQRLASVLATLRDMRASAKVFEDAVRTDADRDRQILLDLQQQVRENARKNEDMVNAIKEELRRQIRGEDDGSGAANSGGRPGAAFAPGDARLELIERGIAAVNVSVEKVGKKVQETHQLVIEEIDRARAELVRVANKNLLSSQGSIPPASVSGLVELCTTSSHVLYLTTYSATPSIPSSFTSAVFKAIRTGTSDEVLPADIERAEAELLALLRLRHCPYTPTPVGFYKPDQHRVGILMEGILWRDDTTGSSFLADLVEEPKPPPFSLSVKSDTGFGLGAPIDLRSYLGQNIVEWSTRFRLMRQFTAGLAYIHDQRIVHGGLSSWDVLVCRDARGLEHVRIVDFDRSYISRETHSLAPIDVSARTHLHPYAAPEMLAAGPSRGHATFATDIFAAGTILWELTFCAEPYDHLDPAAVAPHITGGGRDLVPEMRLPVAPDGAPPFLAALLHAAWAQDPAARPAARQLLAATRELYLPNSATSRRVRRDTSRRSPQEFREAYLRARAGVSADDAASARVLAELLLHPAFPSPPAYARTPAARRAEATRLLAAAADRLGDGGAAFFLATNDALLLGGDGGNKEDADRRRRRCLERARELGHPRAVVALADDDLAAGRIGQDERDRLAARATELERVKAGLATERRRRRDACGALTAVLEASALAATFDESMRLVDVSE